MATYTAPASGGKYYGTIAADQIFGQGGADAVYAGAGNDFVSGGGGNDLLYGQDGNDTLDGNAGSDVMDAGAGADTLVFRLAENAGGTDVYSGALGLDTLRLEFTAAQWGSAVVQSEVARYVAHLASVARQISGEVASGTGSDFAFDFGAGTRLKVSMVEALQVSVDGALVDVNAPRITGHTDAAVGEDDGAAPALAAQGTVGFSDMDLQQSHTVSVSAVAGNALGGSVAGVVADAATGDGQGQVAWSYSLDRAAAQRLAAGQTAIERFNVTVTDSSGKSATQQVSVTVTGANDAPLATAAQALLPTGVANLGYTVTQAQLLQGFTDVDGDTLAAVGLTSDHGTAVQNANGSWTITPTANYTGAVTLSYGVSDGKTTTAATLGLTLALASPVPVNLSDVAAGSGGFVINGQGAGDASGIGVSNAGDVNGDGLQDLIVGALWADPAAGANAGRSYVVFGRSGNVALDLSAVSAGSGGFVINGHSAGDELGYGVSGAGDINGDGLADLIVSAIRGDSSAGANVGRTYVVYGRSGTAPIELSAVAAGNGGFVINGQGADDVSGVGVSGAGDVNGDGLADIIVGAYQSNPAAGTDAGRSYVVFGRSGVAAMDLSAVAAGSGGFVINGQSLNDISGWRVSSAGDVNGDGLADLVVGAVWADAAAGTDAGRSYVVFGRSGTTPVELSAVAAGSGGFVINGQCANDWNGRSVSAAGDVNGDGLADVIVGVVYGDPAGRADAGRSYVVFGRSATGAVELSAVEAGNGGFVINGQCAGNFAGFDVSGAGDINGDGLGDLLISAPYGYAPAGADAGRSFVVFGRSGTTAVELSAVVAGSAGFVINGQCAGDNSGWSVSGAGDVNGDGLADLIVGALYSDPAAGADAGRSYVIFGSTRGAFTQTAVDQMGTSGADTFTDVGTAQTLVAGAGNDTLTATAASVLYGGAGNDVFNINATVVTALQSPLGVGGNLGQLSRIDGGTGMDTIALSGAGIALDLTRIANQAAAGPDGGSRIDSVEKIDLTGTGNNALTLKAADVMDMAGFNSFATTGRHQLLVTGNAGDTLDLADGAATAGWTHGAQTTIGGTAYETWTHNTSLATVYVGASVSVI